ncbi:MAG: ice-binding family protein [Acidobacteria bacterium]|nr:ice-binding family protein [Acidobacteriota bacterium]
MKTLPICAVAILFLPLRAPSAAVFVDLGTSSLFAVLAGSTVTNTGSSLITGNLGVSPGPAITGFPPGSVTGGSVYSAGAVPLQAQNDLTAAYVSAVNQPCGSVLTGQDLGGLTLTPGVYCFSSSAQLTGALTLNSLADPTSVFVFQIGSTLTTASNSNVTFINGGKGANVFWQVGSSATLGTTTNFAGNILALTSITLNTGANINCGRALARNGAVTLDTNNVSIGAAGCEFAPATGPGPGPGPGGSGIPEPATGSLLLLAGVPTLLWQIAKRSRKDSTVRQSPTP